MTKLVGRLFVVFGLLSKLHETRVMQLTIGLGGLVEAECGSIVLGNGHRQDRMSGGAGSVVGDAEENLRCEVVGGVMGVDEGCE